MSRTDELDRVYDELSTSLKAWLRLNTADDDEAAEAYQRVMDLIDESSSMDV